MLSAAALVVLIILLGVWLYQSNNFGNRQADTEQEGNTQNTANSNAIAVRGTTLSYTQAVEEYKDRRIQFDETCLVTPNFATFKEGTKIMLDNRANTSMTISLDSQKHILKAYDFKVIALGTPSRLPHTMMIDCGTGQNNGRILLQQ